MSKKVESLARRMCDGLGLDPDAKVCHMILQEGSSPRGRFVYMPGDSWIGPLWHAYSDVARIALEKSSEVSLADKYGLTTEDVIALTEGKAVAVKTPVE